MSEYRVDDSKYCAGGCHLIFRKTQINDPLYGEFVFDVFALVGGSNGTEIEVGTIDDLDQVRKFVDEFESKAGTKVLGTTIKDGYGDLDQDWS